MASVPKPAARVLHLYRWAPVVGCITLRGPDLTDATASLEIRGYKDQSGAALLALGMADSPAQGLSFSVSTVDGVTYSKLEYRIDEAALEALEPPATSGVTPGADVVLQYAIHITMAGSIKQRWFEGDAIIHAGANQQ